MFCAKCFGTILEDLSNLSKDLNIAMQNGRIGILLLNVVHFNQTWALRSRPRSANLCGPRRDIVGMVFKITPGTRVSKANF